MQIQIAHILSEECNFFLVSVLMKQLLLATELAVLVGSVSLQESP